MHPAFDIRPGLHFCRFGDDYVLLDLPADRYFLVKGPIAHAFTGFLEGRSKASERRILLEQDLIGPARKAGTASIDKPPTATTSLVDRPLPKPPLFDTLRAVCDQRRAQADLHRRPFAEIVRTLGAWTSERFPRDQQASYRSVAAAFQRTRRHVISADRCLARSIAMRRRLAGHGCDARLVIGVTLPFAAHCWVQAGETVLTDPLDVVLHYQPIFAA